MEPPSSNALGKRPVAVDDDDDIDDLDDVLDDFTPNRPVKPAPQTTITTKAATDAPRPPAASTTKSPDAAPQTTTTTKAATDAPRPPAASTTKSPDAASQTTTPTKAATDVPRPPAASASTTKSPDAEATNFMEALASEMEKMVLGLEPHKDPSGSVNGANASGADAGDDAAREKEIRAAWEELFAKTMADISIEAAAGGGESDARGEPKDAFQQIRDENAERLRKSNAEQAGPSPPPDDDLAALLGSGDDDSLQLVLETMMGQLMTKDVLYEPLKELNDKFPSYLSSNADKLSASDLARYQAQHECASKIIAAFEDPEFRDDDPQMTEEIVGLMAKMQEHGAPPAEIMGELPPSLDLGPDGAPKLPDGCVIG